MLKNMIPFVEKDNQGIPMDSGFLISLTEEEIKNLKLPFKQKENPVLKIIFSSKDNMTIYKANFHKKKQFSPVALYSADIEVIEQFVLEQIVLYEKWKNACEYWKSIIMYIYSLSETAAMNVFLQKFAEMPETEAVTADSVMELQKFLERSSISLLEIQKIIPGIISYIQVNN